MACLYAQSCGVAHRDLDGIVRMRGNAAMTLADQQATAAPGHEIPVVLTDRRATQQAPSFKPGQYASATMATAPTQTPDQGERT